MTQALALFYRQLAIPLEAEGGDYRGGQRLGLCVAIILTGLCT